MALLIPSNFQPPHAVRLPGFALEALSVQHAESDFAAVTASASAIRHVFGPQNDWPSTSTSFEENRADLIRHEADFNERRAFVYAVVGLDDQAYLGCFYLRPISASKGRDRRRNLYDAQAFLWLSVLHDRWTDAQVLAELESWLARQWPLKSIAWPGRKPGWADWYSLANVPGAALAPPGVASD